MEAINTYMIVNAIISFFGIYLILISAKMRKDQTLNPNVITKEDINKCKDVKGYIAYTTPKMIIFGATILFVGVMGILEEFYPVIYKYRFLTLIVFLISFVTYILEMRKAKQKFMY